MIVKCPHCAYEAIPYSVKRHMRSIHKLSNDAIKEFTDGLNNGSSNMAVSIVCQLCSETFKTKLAYMDHSKTHSKKSKFVKCGFCAFSTTDQNKMHYHAMDCKASPYTNCYVGSMEEKTLVFSCNVCSKRLENRKLMGTHFETEHFDIQSSIDMKFENMAKYKEWFYEINKNAEESLSVRSTKHIEGFKRLYLRCQTDCRRPILLQSSRLEEKPTYVHHYCPAYLVVTESRLYVRVQGIIKHIHRDGLDHEVIENVKDKNEENHRKCLVELEGVALDEFEEGQWQIGDEIINYNGNCQCQNKNTHCETCDCCSFNFSCSCSNMERVPCIHMHFLSMKIRNDKNKKQEESLLMVTRHKRTDDSREEDAGSAEKSEGNNLKKTRKRKLKAQHGSEASVEEVTRIGCVKRVQKSFRFRKVKEQTKSKPKTITEATVTEHESSGMEVIADPTTEVVDVVEAEEDTLSGKQSKTTIDDVEALFADLIHDTASDPPTLAYLNNEDCAVFSSEPVYTATPFMATEQQSPLDISTEVLSNFSSLTEQPVPESITDDSFNAF